jgi:hypothetical protein
MSSQFTDAVEHDGFAIVPDALDADLVSALSRAVSGFAGGRREQGVHRRGDVYAIRNLFDLVPETRRALEASWHQDDRRGEGEGQATGFGRGRRKPACSTSWLRRGLFPRC